MVNGNQKDSPRAQQGKGKQQRASIGSPYEVVQSPPNRNSIPFPSNHTITTQHLYDPAIHNRSLFERNTQNCGSGSARNSTNSSSLTGHNYPCEAGESIQQVKRRMASVNASSFEEWKRKNNLRAWQRVFSICPHLPIENTVGGALHAFRQALEKNGWVENEDISSSGGNSKFWDLKFGLKIADLGISPGLIHDKSSRDKIVNFFGNVGEMTTKLGLQRNIERYTKNLPFQIMGTSYDLSDKRSFERFLYAYQRQYVRSLLSDLREKLEFVSVSTDQSIFFQNYTGDQQNTYGLMTHNKDGKFEGKSGENGVTVGSPGSSITATPTNGGTPTSGTTNCPGAGEDGGKAPTIQPVTSASGKRIVGTTFCYIRSELHPDDPLCSPDLNLDELEEFLDALMSIYRKRQVSLQPQIPGGSTIEEYLSDKDWLKLLLLKDKIFNKGKILQNYLADGGLSGAGMSHRNFFSNSNSNNSSPTAKDGFVSAANREKEAGKGSFAETQRLVNRFVGSVSIKREKRPGTFEFAGGSSMAGNNSRNSRGSQNASTQASQTGHNSARGPVIISASGVTWSREGNYNTITNVDSPLAHYRQHIDHIFPQKRSAFDDRKGCGRSFYEPNSNHSCVAPTTRESSKPNPNFHPNQRLASFLISSAARHGGKLPNFLIFQEDNFRRAELQDIFRNLRQQGLDGKSNMWILKPSNQSRGRGIQVVSELEQILRNLTIFYQKSSMDALRNNPLYRADGPLMLQTYPLLSQSVSNVGVNNSGALMNSTGVSCVAKTRMSNGNINHIPFGRSGIRVTGNPLPGELSAFDSEHTSSTNSGTSSRRNSGEQPSQWITTTTASISPRGNKTQILGSASNKNGSGSSSPDNSPKSRAVREKELDQTKSPTTCSNQCNNLRNNCVNMICQKYIEQPQIIQNFKFDIRQWLVVTSWDAPKNVRAWYYDEFYLRFGAREYNSNSFDPYIHLTNNAVTKLCPDRDIEINNTMWSNHQYREYLERNLSTVRISYDKVVAQIRMIMWITIHAVQKKMPSNRENNCFEIFGFDFMIDVFGHVWLIEVNTSPDLSFSTSTTRHQVSGMMRDLATLLTKCETNVNRGVQRQINQAVVQGLDRSCGNFKLLTANVLKPEWGRLLGLEWQYPSYRSENEGKSPGTYGGGYSQHSIALQRSAMERDRMLGGQNIVKQPTAPSTGTMSQRSKSVTRVKDEVSKGERSNSVENLKHGASRGKQLTQFTPRSPRQASSRLVSGRKAGDMKDAGEATSSDDNKETGAERAKKAAWSPTPAGAVSPNKNNRKILDAANGQEAALTSKDEDEGRPGTGSTNNPHNVDSKPVVKQQNNFVTNETDALFPVVRKQGSSPSNGNGANANGDKNSNHSKDKAPAKPRQFEIAKSAAQAHDIFFKDVLANKFGLSFSTFQYHYPTEQLEETLWSAQIQSSLGRPGTNCQENGLQIIGHKAKKETKVIKFRGAALVDDFIMKDGSFNTKATSVHHAGSPAKFNSNLLVRSPATNKALIHTINRKSGSDAKTSTSDNRATSTPAGSHERPDLRAPNYDIRTDGKGRLSHGNRNAQSANHIPSQNGKTIPQAFHSGAVPIIDRHAQNQHAPAPDLRNAKSGVNHLREGNHTHMEATASLTLPNLPKMNKDMNRVHSNKGYAKTSVASKGHSKDTVTKDAVTTILSDMIMTDIKPGKVSNKKDTGRMTPGRTSLASKAKTVFTQSDGFSITSPDFLVGPQQITTGEAAQEILQALDTSRTVVEENRELDTQEQGGSYRLEDEKTMDLELRPEESPASQAGIEPNFDPSTQYISTHSAQLVDMASELKTMVATKGLSGGDAPNTLGDHFF